MKRASTTKIYRLKQKSIEVALDTDQGHKTMKKLSYIFLVAVSMMLSSCSEEFWQGMAMGGASFLGGMANSYMATPSSGWDYNNVPNVANYVGGWSQSAVYTNSATTSSSSSTTSTGSGSSSNHQCPLCHGKGTIVHDSYTATYGSDYKKYCSTCGQSFMASTGHSHITCTQCHGKGYF